MTKLAALLFSVQREEILLPRLRAFLAKERDAIITGKIASKSGEIKEADLTIAAMQERKVEFNHGAVEGDKYKDYYHPSQIGGCIRRQWFDQFKAPMTASVNDDVLRSELIFAFGTHIHIILQNLCHRAGVLEQREVPVVDHVRKIVGHADGILVINGKRYLLEIKTINDRGYQKLVEAKPEHIEQSTLYLGLLKLDGVIVLYVNKNTSEMKEFRSMFNKSLYEKRLLPRIAKFKQDVKNRILPNRESEDPHRFPCTYCGYTEVCWNPTKLTAYLKTIKAKRPVSL